MHKRLRIAFSKRVELIQTDIDACDATIRHITDCPNCTEEDLCAEGDALYQNYLLANARAKMLMEDDTPYVI
jgi:hypothetical protein